MKHFNKDWYKNGCKATPEIEQYIQYEKEYFPKWYNDFSFHDSQILSVENHENYILLNLKYDDCLHTEYQLKLHNPKIIEPCELENAWWLFNELYATEKGFEFHIMTNDYYDNDIYRYFTVECTDLELILLDKAYSIKHSFDEEIDWGNIYDEFLEKLGD